MDGVFYALNPDGGLKWRLRTGGITESSPVIGQDGTLFVGVNESLWAITPDGKKKWERGQEGLVSASPVVLADNSVCSTSGYGYLMNLVGPTQVNWMFPMQFNAKISPAIGARGTLFTTLGVVNVGFFLDALTGEAPLAQSPWPMFRGNPQHTGRPK